MKLVYEYNESQVVITEKKDGGVNEFFFSFLDQSLEKGLSEVRNYFYGNDDDFDAFFYTNLDKQVKVTVKDEYYTDFLLQLFKQKILISLKWE